ncbi:choline transporter-like protein 1 [Penaeus japonicus]|uniref:choline transporter-like protein 1 n=1 Tax=Penaeus japonicus TaxID=27405 RepID=UPI001C70CE4E|nr:choline transporter-like protein 1 [Penaeus japonicus]
MRSWRPCGLILFIITVTVFLVCLLVLIFLRKRINIAIALIGQASKAVGDIMSTLFFPVVPYILQLFFLAFFCVVALYLSSVGRQSTESCAQEKFAMVARVLRKMPPVILKTLTTLLALEQCASFMIIMLIPTYLAFISTMCSASSMFFISAFGEMVLAGAAWYLAFDKSKDVPSLPVTYSFGRTLSGNFTLFVTGTTSELLPSRFNHRNNQE